MVMPSTDWRKTACNLCYVNCGLEVLVENDRIGRERARLLDGAGIRARHIEDAAARTARSTRAIT